MVGLMLWRNVPTEWLCTRTVECIQMIPEAVEHRSRDVTGLQAFVLVLAGWLFIELVLVVRSR